ncbi:MAG: zf-HC2 domain-containing protein [Deltaproteobacteria bacterium]|nr:zf-HC2 domain-containing protein [Deltaproteobacteria bacterium]MBW2018171.1 zf-HC2 domain-containing protein [Deltaproteobacteria bacterium]
MKGCRKGRDMLLKEVHGELDPEARRALDAHLRVCESCRQERISLMKLMDKMKDHMQPPILSEREVDESVRRIRRRLHKGINEKQEKGLWGLRPVRVLSLAAALCILILVVVLQNGERAGNHGVRQTTLKTRLLVDEGIGPEEREIIANLELLREMDALEKLVHVVDRPKKSRPTENRETNIHGMNRYGKILLA